MPDRIRAWIETNYGAVQASYVSALMPHRVPATEWFSREEDARAWIEHEARVLGVPVEWDDGSACGGINRG